MNRKGLKTGSEQTGQCDLLEIVFENISEGVIVVSADGDILNMNPAALEMYSLKDIDEARKLLVESADKIEIFYLDGKSVSRDAWPVLRSCRGEDFYNVELLIRRTDTGRTVIINHNGTCVRDDNGKVILGIITFMNITERKRIEDAVGIREAQYRAIFELSGSGKVQIDPVTGKFLRVNPKFCEITGYSSQELLAMTSNDLTHPDDRKSDLDGFDRLRMGQIPDHSIEKRIVRKNGTIAWVHVTATVVRDIAGVPTIIIGTVQDITGRKKAEDALRESEERFRNLAENANLFIGIVQGNRFVYVNPYILKVSGYTHEELLTIDISRIVHKDFREMVLDRARRRQLGEPVETNYRFKIVTKDGAEHWLDFSAARVMHMGKPAIVGMALDITDRVRIEEALRQSERRFASFMHNLPGAAWIKDLQFRYVYINNEAQRIFSRSLDAMKARTDAEIFPPETARQFHQNDQKALDEGTITTVEVLLQADGVEHHSIVNKFIIRGGDGQPTYIGGVAFDITDRVRSEEVVRESEEKFRLLAENANAVIGVMQGAHFVYVNHYLEEISGYTRDELLTIDLAKMLHPDFRRMVLERAARRQAGEDVPDKYQFIMITKFGQERWMDFCAARIIYRGKPAIVGIAVDITESKRYEEQLTRLKDDLEGKNRELEAIIGVVSHDLRAPLVNVKGFAEEIKMDCERVKGTLAGEKLTPSAGKIIEPIVNKSVPESLGFIETSTTAMSRLIESLIQVARAGIAIVKPEKLEMNALISEVIEALEFKIKQKNTQVTVESLPPCTSDRTQTAQIFSNLIDNAVKYLNPSRPGQIHISGRLKNGKVTYIVEDNGIGIPLDKQDKIFEIFYRFEKKLAGGEGIGLAMVRRMAQRNGGQVCLESEPDKGSRFFVELLK